MVKSLRVLFLFFALMAFLFVYPVQTAYAIAIPAEINKQFTPILIDAGGISVLRVTIFNPNLFPLTNASWNDNLIGVQPGLQIANPAGVVNTCGGSIAAVPGTTTFSLSAGTVPAQVGSTPGECYVEVNVTSTVSGNLINTIPPNNLSASGNDGGIPVSITNTTPASATITVIAVTPPSISKGFSPNTVWVGQTSTLTITINNNDTNTNLTQTAYTDTLPANVVLASPVSPTLTNCGAGASLNAVSGTNTVALSNATVTPNLNCIVTVNVISGIAGTYTNTIPAGPGGPGSITTQQGVTNGSPASAQLNVQPVGITKAFSPANVVAGETSTLTITLQNPTGSDYTGVNLTDNLPTGLTISGTPASPQCGGTITNTATSVTLTGGTIPASVSPPTPLGTCTITVTVATADNSPTAARTNTIPAGALTTDQLVTNPAPATSTLNVQSGITVLKSFSPSSITVGGISTVTITLRNHTSADFTGVNLTDTLPANLTVFGTPASPQCGGTITNTANSVTITGGTIPFSPTPPGTCTITFQVTSSVAATYSNTIPAGDLTTTEGPGNTSTTTTSPNLTVNPAGGPVQVSKAFQTSPIAPGGRSRLRITITAPADIGVSGINISDNLPGDLVIVGTPTAPANPVTTCGGTLTAAIGTQLIRLIGGAIANPSGTCTITVYVTTGTPGSYPNNIPANNVTTTEGRTNTSASNTPVLVVTGLSTSKAFYPPTVNTNGLSTLTITLQNTDDSPLINVSLTDNLPGTASNGVVVAPTPNVSTTCAGGSVTAVAGTQSITMTGGVIPPQVGGIPGICTINVDVQGLGIAASYNNTIPTNQVSGTVQSTGSVIRPAAQAQATLTIADLTIAVVKGFNPVLVYGGGSSTMSVQLVNPNNAVLTGVAFTDNMALLGTGMYLANPTNFNVGTCGGFLTGNPGDSSFSFSGGTINANSNCVLTLSVVMDVNGNLTNRIPAGAVTTSNGAGNTQAAEATLTDLPGASVSKSFNPNPVLVGEYSSLTITITNSSNIPLAGMALNDNLPVLPTGLTIADYISDITIPAPVNNCNGTLTATPGTQLISLSGGSLVAADDSADPSDPSTWIPSSCTIIVSVVSSVPGVFINTIPQGGLTADGGISNNIPATDTLVVSSSLYSLGNRVWLDTDNSGTINGTEVGINGVDVELYAADGSGNPTGPRLDIKTTANGGYYRFDDLVAGDYVVVIPSAEFGVGGTLNGYWSSATSLSGAGTTETAAPDPDNDIDNDDNGTLHTPIDAFTGAVISSAVTLGGLPVEPTNDTNADPTNPPGEAVDNRSNRTVDFGFYRLALSNQIYVDANNNGTYDAGDVTLSGAQVQLFASDGITEINVGADGIWGTADDLPGGVATGAGGTYLFTGLPQGDYVVKVTPPVGYSSAVDTFNNADTTTPNNNTNNNDNGIGTGTGQVTSGVVTLTPGSLGAATNNIVSNVTGTTTNPTLDFGFTIPLYSLGNRIWFDTDNSSTINGLEAGVNFVTVQLYAADGSGNPTGAVLATRNTANGGYYRFDNLLAGDYVVVIPASEFGTGGVLDGYWSSATSLSGAGTTETAAPDPDNDTDNDDNGTLQTSGAFNGAVISGAITLGPGASEPTNDTNADPTNPSGEAVDAQSNRTVDFGFYRLRIGNQIYTDVNSNGTFDAGDTALAAANVRLFASDGTTEINVGPDGIFGTADDAAGGVTTGVAGTYLFSGLPQGSYIVKVTPPAGYTSTVDTANAADTTTPNNNIDNNDNGIGVGTGQVSSNAVTLTPGSLGAATNNTVTNATGTTYNPTLDFGFIAPLFSLGNRVWFDTDNSSTINGAEVGIDLVVVQLYRADVSGNPTGAVLDSQTTDNGGYYRFDGLSGGDYVVVIPSSEFGVGGKLFGYLSSGTTISIAGVITGTLAPDPDNNVDNDDNGTLQTTGTFSGAVISRAITLGPTPNEPINDTDADPTNPPGEEVNNQSNRTVDFGFYRLQLSNQIFIDGNNNGTYDAGDGRLAGATVQLFASNGTTEVNVGPDGIYGTADDAAGGVTTGLTGSYLFSGLPQGNYIVRVTPPYGFASAIDTANSGDSTTPNNNIDNNDNGIGTGIGQVSSNVFPLTPGSLGAASNNTVDHPSGTTTNPTLDFGFTPLFSLGNRVWFDTDNSSTINGSEVGVNGVTVQLYAADGGGNPSGLVLDTQVTANGGYYRFDNLPAQDYVVVIPASQFDTGGVLDGYWSSATTLSGAGTAETAAPDPDNDLDNDDNGTLQTSGTFTGAVISRAITLGPLPDEPLNDADSDPTSPAGEAPNLQSNRTVDFGFYRVAVSNQIYFDVNQNGTYDAGDLPHSGATVRLYTSDGATEINIGPDGIFGTADDAPGGVTTGAGGTYLISGLPQGSYVIKVTPQLGYTSAVDTFNPADIANPNTNIDNNDNGLGTASGQATSNAITLTPGSLGAASNNTVTDATGTTTNPTMDFGFYAPLFSLGNRVWFDTDNSATINGSEVGIDDVEVELYVADGSGNPTGGVLATQTTAHGGYYRFDGLLGGDYVVVIPGSEFLTGGTLLGYRSSGTTIDNAGLVTEAAAPDPDNDIDNDDNGTRQTSGAFSGAVIGQAVTLGPSVTEPTGETDADPTNPPGEAVDNQSNRTVDFGFFRLQLSNQIFIDVNGNGTYDAGDAPLAGATVRLFAGNSTTEVNVGPDGVFGTADDAPGGLTTGVAGTYLFSGLPQGNYIVIMTPPSGFSSTVDTADSGDTLNPNNNIDNNDNGVGIGSGPVSSNIVTLTPGNTGTASNNTVDNATGSTSNPTVDFGVTPLYSLGNRVWFDTDNSGTINGSEVGVNGVDLELYAADGSGNPTGLALGIQTTANGGYYRFDDVAAGSYVVVIPSTELAVGGTLNGYWSSGTTLSGAGTAETAAPGPDNNTDNDDNGTLQISGAFNGAVLSGAVTLGPGLVEPTNDTDADPTNPAGEAPNNQSNRTVDFGFYRVELSNQIFVDVVDDGTYGAGDFVLPGAIVQLFASNGTTEINVGPDGILGTADDAPGGMTTGPGGVYLFSGLPQGSYIVAVTPLTGYASTVDTAAAGDTTNPNLNVNNNDNGIGTGTGQVFSNAVTLTPGNAATNNVVTNSTGTTTNPTLDFGFTASFTKAFVSTDATHTTDPQVTIGEIITYQINMFIPVGTLNNVLLVDTPQDGLAFVECIDITIPPNVTSSNIASGTCDTSDGTTPGVSNPLIENLGRRITFDFGDVTNSSASPQAITIQYSMIVLDISSNQNRDTLTNSAVWTWTGGTKTTAAPPVEIVEPRLTIDKNALPTSATYGTPITFTIAIAHDSVNSTADAFDVVVTDRIPTGFTFIPGTITSSGTAALTSSNYNSTTNTLTFVWDVFRLNETASVSFQAIFVGPAPVVNSASVEWSSLLIDPQLPGPPPVPEQLSDYNPNSTERWYDPSAPAGVNNYIVRDTVSVTLPDVAQLPKTGFAPGVVTDLPPMPADFSYVKTDLWIEIPKLKVKLDIVGVPYSKDEKNWDLKWLSENAGWLENTAYPTHNGNSALTAHSTLSNGKPGPFASLDLLKYGDQIIVHLGGQKYIYEVREVKRVNPDAVTSVLKHEDYSWLTLITCKSYNEKTGEYVYRSVARAVLVKVVDE